MKSEKEELARLLIGMQTAFKRGENVMAWARANSSCDNTTLSTLIAYDIQSGSYVESARRDKNFIDKWCKQLSNVVRPLIESDDTILEVGVGEATTLVGLMNELSSKKITAYGFDLSWSRISVANKWVFENKLNANLFVADLFNIPIEDNSVDIVYTSHSIEPNRGKEEMAVKELLRVARKAVVLIEPCYESATRDVQLRMDEHGYVKGLRSIVKTSGANIVDDRLLDVNHNPLNPARVLTLAKPQRLLERKSMIKWRDPLTGVPMIDKGDYFLAEQVGISYPVLKGIPCLRAEHAIICSKI